MSNLSPKRAGCIALLNKSENATLQFFILCKKVQDILNSLIMFSRHPANDSQIFLFLCLGYVPFSVLSFIH